MLLVSFNQVPYMQISDMIPGVNISSGKVSIASMKLGGRDSSRIFSGQNTLRKFLSSEEHLDWLKIDFSVAEIIAIQDYKYKKTNVN